MMLQTVGSAKAVKVPVKDEEPEAEQAEGTTRANVPYAKTNPVWRDAKTGELLNDELTRHDFTLNMAGTIEYHKYIGARSAEKVKELEAQNTPEGKLRMTILKLRKQLKLRVSQYKEEFSKDI